MIKDLSDEPEKLIDYPSALDRTGGDEEFLNELLYLYVTEFSSAYKKLRTAVKEKDFSNVKYIGHSLKGSSANLSLLRLQEAAVRIEHTGKEEDADKAEKALLNLEKEFQRLKDYLAAR
ncbi:MAG: Hpt domain-containing protein [Candidatus Aminicenantes bacterium]|nr:Hpt domain-containing protein [Candidatus Aminicenantes bacterium]